MMDNLKVTLANLENAGIETRDFNLIKNDVQYGSSVITLIRNDKFEVKFDRFNRTINFQTTYSNQSITDNFINQVMEIKDVLSLLEGTMQFIFKEESA